MTRSLSFSLLSSQAAVPALVVLFAALVIGSVTDLRSRKLPNLLTFGTALLGIVLHGALGGGWEMASSLVSCILALFAGFTAYALFGGQGFGAGDAKMVMAAAALIGFWPAIWLFFASNLAMAVLYLPVRWLVQRTFWVNAKGVFVWLLSILTAILSKVGLAQKGAHVIHFTPVGMQDNTPHAPFMLIGAICVVTLAQHGALPW